MALFQPNKRHVSVSRVWRVLHHTATICCERTKSPPFGLQDGHAGAPTRVHVSDPQGNRHRRLWQPPNTATPTASTKT